MLTFGKRRSRRLEVQRLLTKIINANCRAIDALREGPRSEARIDLAMVVIVVPQNDDQPVLPRAFATVTKEVSSTGMSLVVTDQVDFEKLFLAFDFEGEMKYVRAEVRHQSPLGAGLLHAGVQLTEVVTPGDYPELLSLKI